MTTRSSSPRPCTRTHTRSPSSVCGTEYSPSSKLTIGVFDRRPLRVSPNATVCGWRGQPVQPGPFLGEHLGRRPAGDPVRPGR